MFKDDIKHTFVIYIIDDRCNNQNNESKFYWNKIFWLYVLQKYTLWIISTYILYYLNKQKTKQKNFTPIWFEKQNDYYFLSRDTF